jgi:hypothetical protein
MFIGPAMFVGPAMFIGPALFVGQSTTDGRHLIARLIAPQTQHQDNSVRKVHMDMMRAKGHLKEYDTFAVETSFWASPSSQCAAGRYRDDVLDAAVRTARAGTAGRLFA